LSDHVDLEGRGRKEREKGGRERGREEGNGKKKKELRRNFFL